MISLKRLDISLKGGMIGDNDSQEDSDIDSHFLDSDSHEEDFLDHDGEQEAFPDKSYEMEDGDSAHLEDEENKAKKRMQMIMTKSRQGKMRGKASKDDKF